MRIRRTGHASQSSLVFESNSTCISDGASFAYTPYSERSWVSDSLHKGPPYRSGGDFLLQKTTTRRSSTGQVAALFGNGSLRWRGEFIVDHFGRSDNSDASNLALLSDASTSVAQVKLWKKARPGQARASTGQGLLELRKIPTLPGPVKAGFRLLGLGKFFVEARAKTGFFKGLGQDYLNVEFGWKPFLKDLQEAVKATRGLHRDLEQLRRDNGKTVRRRASLPGESTSSATLVSSTLWPPLTSGCYAVGSSKKSVVITDNRQHWFSAAFRYYIPDIGSSRWTTRATAALYGLNPTPSLLWEVLPWSWLIDWAVPVGDILSNISGNAAENLAAKYAYAMTSRERVEEASCTTSYVGLGPISATSTRTSISKSRHAANPFGFGLTFDGLSGRQMLILGALGLSRHA
jgi:hypothetical protein